MPKQDSPDPFAVELRQILDGFGLDVEPHGAIVKTANLPTNVGVRPDLVLGKALYQRLRTIGPRDIAAGPGPLALSPANAPLTYDAWEQQQQLSGVSPEAHYAELAWHAAQLALGHDVLSVSRLLNPDGWTIQLRQNGNSGKVHYFYGDLTLAEAVDRARAAQRV